MGACAQVVVLVAGLWCLACPTLVGPASGVHAAAVGGAGSVLSRQRLDFVLSFTYQTSRAMIAQLALPTADLIVGNMRCLQMAFAASVPLHHHDQTRSRPSDRLAGWDSHPLEIAVFHGVLVCRDATTANVLDWAAG